MRKPVAILALFACIVVCAVSLSHAETGRVPADSRSVRTDSRVPVTVHSLLRDRLDLTLRLARAFRFMEPPLPVDEPVYGTNGIIDEPDPAGARDDGSRERDRGREQRQRYQDSANDQVGPQIEGISERE